MSFFFFFANYFSGEIVRIKRDNTGSLIVRESTQKLLIQIFFYTSGN